MRAASSFEWATAEQTQQAPAHALQSRSGTPLIGHPTKPSFRSGNFCAGPHRVRADQRLRRALPRLGLRGRRFWPAIASGRHAPSRSSIAPASITCGIPRRRRGPSEWKQGGNVAYLQRPISPHAVHPAGLLRAAGDLTVRLADETAAGACRLLSLLGDARLDRSKPRAECGPIWSCFAVPDGAASPPAPIAESLAVFDESLSEPHRCASRARRSFAAGQLGSRRPGAAAARPTWMACGQLLQGRAVRLERAAA